MMLMPNNAELLEHSQIRSTQLGIGKTHHFWANLSLPWVKEIFLELERDNENNLSNGLLDIQLEIKKLSEAQLDYPIVVTGEIRINYLTQCVRCLDEVHQKLVVPVQAYFMAEGFQDSEEYQEQDVVYADNKELDLYFMDKKQIDLELIVREAIFLNVDSFPLHDENCLGLCQECGHNLNVDRCSCPTVDN